ncbi:peptidoglycan DD-metalloendopeptidase family protein [Paenibacillus ehimensis]|uniref:peptidoglycan DD-metalloendopeptidase family protein n=1 Tax=Paenibacillus ehimensis TaxID=79264 RepID=UPI003D2902AC
METRKNVRERRSEKIRKLQEGGGRRPGRDTEYAHFEFPSGGEIREWEWDRDSLGTGSEWRFRSDDPRGLPGPYSRQEGPTRPGLYDPADPEEEWNRKWQRELSRMSREDDGGTFFRPGGPRAGRLAVRLLISGMLFAAVWGMFLLDRPWANKGKQWVTAALTEPFDTVALASWYESKFGSAPSFLPAMNPAKHTEAQKVAVVSKHYFPPVAGKLIAPFTPVQGGILVEAAAGSPVATIDTGLVTFAGPKEDIGFTVVLRHAEGMESVYGHLEPGKVQPGDWFKGGESIGTIAEPAGGQGAGTLFFAVSKNGKPVNPMDVISFD